MVSLGEGMVVDQRSTCCISSAGSISSRVRPIPGMSQYSDIGIGIGDMGDIGIGIDMRDIGIGNPVSYRVF